jgi:hypothetical protein
VDSPLAARARGQFGGAPVEEDRTPAPALAPLLEIGRRGMDRRPETIAASPRRVYGMDLLLAALTRPKRKCQVRRLGR